MSNKVKCAYLYMSQTTTQKGDYSGSIGGVGLTTGGLGVGLGGVSGSIDTENQSKLAEMFRPVKNEVTYSSDSDIIPRLMGVAFFIAVPTLLKPNNGSENVGVINSMIASAQFQNVMTAICFSAAIFMGFKFLQILQNPKKTYKYSSEAFKNISDNYAKADYDPETNTVSLDNVEYPATRSNFLKLIGVN